MWWHDYWRTLREKAELTEKPVCHCITEIKCINRFVVSDLLWFLRGNSAITYIVFLGWGITSFLSSGSSKEWPCWITCLLQWRKQSWHTCREATVVVYHIFSIMLSNLLSFFGMIIAPSGLKITASQWTMSSQNDVLTKSMLVMLTGHNKQLNPHL